MAARPACMAASSVALTEEMPLPKEKGRPSLEEVSSALTGIGAGLSPPACMFSGDSEAQESSCSVEGRMSVQRRSGKQSNQKS